jgi:hypothetical protein
VTKVLWRDFRYNLFLDTPIRDVQDDGASTRSNRHHRMTAQLAEEGLQRRLQLFYADQMCRSKAVFAAL